MLEQAISNKFRPANGTPCPRKKCLSWLPGVFVALQACTWPPAGASTAETDKVNAAAHQRLKPRSNVRVLLDHVGLARPSWAPDGSELVVDNEDLFGLRIVSVDDGAVRELTRNPRNVRPAWSPLEGRVAYVDASGLQTIETFGEGFPQRLLSGPVHLAAAPWSPDGRSLLVSTSGGLAIVEVPSGKTRLLVERDGNGMTLGGGAGHRTGRKSSGSGAFRGYSR